MLSAARLIAHPSGTLPTSRLAIENHSSSEMPVADQNSSIRLDHKATLACLQPTRHQRIYDMVACAGMDVSDWANYANGKKSPASNPKYCYEWAFRADNLVVLNIWHSSLGYDDLGLICHLNLRTFSSAVERAQDMPWLSRESKLVWSRRARRMDLVFQHAAKNRLPVRVVICDGKMNDLAAGDTEPDEVKARLLDPAVWSVESYDFDSGDLRLRRHADEVRAPVDHIAASALRADWIEWMKSEASLEDWKNAARGIRDHFMGWPEGGLFRCFPKKEKDGTYWVEVQKPLPGLHLIAFMLRRDVAPPTVSLRVWVNDDYPDVYRRFELAPSFALSGRSTARYLKRRPPSNFNAQLPVGVTLTGVEMTVDCSFMGRPGADALAALFNSFSQYAVDCHSGVFEVVQDGPAGEAAVSSRTDPWDEDEANLAQIEAMDLSHTEKLVLAKARINQSSYRKKLLERWGRKCSITGFSQVDYLVASHILPWSKCESAKDRWSPDNGLLLPPGIDLAFELGDVSFDDRGKILLSKRGLHLDAQIALGLRPTFVIRDFYDYPGIGVYLRLHREMHKVRLGI